MKKYILCLIIALCPAAFLPLMAQNALPGQWRIHNTYDSYMSEVIDTPDRIYTLALGVGSFPSMDSWREVKGQLFVTDKASGETTGYNANNYLSGNVILDIEYNPDKRYLLIVYNDYKIDLLYDDDALYSIPALASASISASKNINSITFDPQNNRAYLATDFGYLVLDDKKKVISESRIYNTPVNALARVGERLVLGNEQGLFTAPVDERHTSLDSFTPVPGYTSNVKYVLPLTDSTFAIVEDRNITKGSFAPDGSLSMELKSTEDPKYVCVNRNGYFLRRNNCAMQIDRATGDVTKYYPSECGRGEDVCGSWDMRTFYFAVPRTGIEQYTFNKNEWKWAKGFTYTPNAPQVFLTHYFDYSPDYGMLAGMSSTTRFNLQTAINYPSLVSGYKDGSWTQYGREAADDSPFRNYMRDTYGPVVDPINPDHIWLGSRRNGLFRCSLADGSVEMFSNPEHPANAEPGFHAIFPYSNEWPEISHAMAPAFDNKGNLWVMYNTSHSSSQRHQPLYCWPAEDRKKGNVKAFRNMPIGGYKVHYERHIMIATRSPYSLGFVIFGPNWQYNGPFYVYYHAGTIDDPTDDRSLYFEKMIDQDGNQVPYTYLNNFREDLSTGNIWVCTNAGVFYFDPKEAVRTGENGGILRVRRVKVARNDGTNLADYLLDGYDVTDMASDGAGRKWFVTAGNGVFVTSSDGSHIIEHINTENSKLPSDILYSVGFDPSGNAVWFGGSQQISTYYCDATFPEEDYSNVMAFPNPVRPEYSGPVTIRGLMSDSLVKIADASGAVVKELGLSNGGMVVWDLTDNSGRAVGAGVYYVLSSTSSESTPTAGNTTKILVVR